MGILQWIGLATLLGGLGWIVTVAFGGADTPSFGAIVGPAVLTIVGALGIIGMIRRPKRWR